MDSNEYKKYFKFHFRLDKFFREHFQSPIALYKICQTGNEILNTFCTHLILQITIDSAFFAYYLPNERKSKFALIPGAEWAHTICDSLTEPNFIVG